MAMALNPGPLFSAVRNALLWVSVFLIVATLSGWIHELGHFAAARSLGVQATLSFDGGGHVDTIPEAPNLRILLAGPTVTWLLALLSVLMLWRAKPERISLLDVVLTSTAIWNSLFRLSMWLDGAHSDEGKIATLLGCPFLLVAIPATALSLFLAHVVLKSRVPSVWEPLAILGLFVASAAALRIGFAILAAPLSS